MHVQVIGKDMHTVVACISVHYRYACINTNICNKWIGSPKYNINIVPFSDTIHCCHCCYHYRYKYFVAHKDTYAPMLNHI